MTIWIFSKKKLCFAFSFLQVHAFKYILSSVHNILPPPQMIWFDPGYIPSFSANYELPNTFFFNLQIALLALQLFYLFFLGDVNYFTLISYLGFSYFAIFILFPSIIYQMILLIVFRVNYSIGIIYILIICLFRFNIRHLYCSLYILDY